MARSAILAVKIVSDAVDAQKGIDQTEQSVGRFQSTMSKAGAVAGVAAAGIAAFGVSAVRAAADDAKAQALLATALRNSTGASDAAIAATERWISKTALATGVADDQLRPAMASLARATGDVATSQDAMGVALDVAAATGKDVGSVADALAKAYAGQTTALARLVPGMDKTILASGDMNAIMAELARTTGGSAAAAADTAAGRMARIGLAADETKEAIGSALLPALTSLTGVLTTAATWAANNATVFTVLLGVVGGLAAGIFALSVAMRAYATVATFVSGVQRLLNASTLATRVQLAALAVQQAVVTGATAAYGAAQSFLTTTLVAGLAAARAWVITQAQAVAAAIATAAATVAQTAATVASTVAQTAASVAARAWAVAQTALNIVLTANPIGLVIVAVVALVAAIVLAYRNSETFRAIVDAAFRAVLAIVTAVVNWVRANLGPVFSTAAQVARAALSAIGSAIDDVLSVARAVGAALSNTLGPAFRAVQSVASSALSAILAPFRAIESAIDSVIGAVQSLISALGRIKVPSINIPGLPFLSAAAGRPAVPSVAAARVASPTVSVAGRSVAGGAPGGRSGAIVINVNVPPTANPVEVGREVVSVIRKFERAAGAGWRQGSVYA